MFSKESLEQLRSRIDLVEVLSPYVKLQRAGAAHKGLCPFHEEKTPSFVVQKGDSHYHCFGCGAHGDAIQFLMIHLRLGFAEAVESLAERFQVELEEASGTSDAPKGPSKAVLKDALQKAADFYTFCLLHTHEGHAALDYLYSRGIDLEFIRQFGLGLALKEGSLFLAAMRQQNVTAEVLEKAGLGSKGRSFFTDRITIPIRDATGSIIGFSARKYKLDTFGGKYINTPETPLFKKSKVLFGLSFSRKTIAKEKKALIVEGQIDALRLIYLGFNWTVAGQGTAFGEEQAKELIQLGVRQVYLALDGDGAGQEAAMKIGHIFQKQGIDALVVSLPEKTDPDLLLQEKGPQEWQKLLNSSADYLTFLVKHLSCSINLQSPAGKNELVQTIAQKIREWDHPLMIHESLRKLARLTQTPESILSVQEMPMQPLQIRRAASVGFSEIDPDKILEADLLRWLFLMGESCPQFIALAKANLQPEYFRNPTGKFLFQKYLEKPCDLLSLTLSLEEPQQQVFLTEVLEKKINRERAESCFRETVQKLLERHWMQRREEIKLKIYSGTCSETEVLELARKFDELKKARPQVVESA